jgi:hypothetical protein
LLGSINSGENKIAAIRQQVQQESQTLGPDHWAGSYCQGDGLGENIYLDIAPQSGFAFEWWGCLGLYDRNHGKAKAKGDRIRLSFVLPNRQEALSGLANEFLFVRWGQRHYLIPRDEIIRFCNEINDKMEPRDQPHGFFLLRVGDEQKTVLGKPKVPEHYAGYLLDQPINARITKVLSRSMKNRGIDFTVEINVGKEHKVLEGMVFRALPGFLIEASVIKVGDHSSTAVFYGLTGPVPEEGWKLSTSSYTDPNSIN